MSKGPDSIIETYQCKESSASYHRWFVFVSACVGMINGFGLLASIGRLLVIVMETFRISRAEAALVQSMASGIMGVAGVITGSLVHKFHPRKCGMVGSCLTVLGFSLFFFATSVIYLYIGIGLMYGIGVSLVAISSTTTIGLYFTGIGVSLVAISSTTTIGLYFQGKLKLTVLSLISVASALAGMVYPYIIVILNDTYGLHGALLIIGAILSHSFAASLLWGDPVTMKEGVKSIDRYNDMTETNDQAKASFIPEKSKSTKTERSTLQSLKSLIGNKMFMAFVIAATFTALSVNVFQFLLVDIFRDKGLNGDHSSLALLLMSLFSILGRFSSGTLTVIPQVTVLHISIVGSSVLAISYVSLIFVKSLPLSLFVSCVFGVCMGICRAQFTVTISRLLDGKSLSLGMGLLFTLYGCLNIFMGTICGYARDQLGSYRPIFVGAAAVAGTGSCLFGIAQYFSSPSYHRWFVFVSACVGMINGFGLLASIGRLLVIVMETFRISRAEAALVQSMASGIMGVAGVITGSLVHKFHPRKCGMVGSCLTVLGFSLCFFATSVIYLYIGIGLMYGIGVSLVAISSTTTIGLYFTGIGVSLVAISSTTTIGLYFQGKLKLTVLSLISVASALAGMVYPYIIVILNDTYGLHGALLIIGAILSHSFAASLLWGDPVTMKEGVKSIDRYNDMTETNDQAKASFIPEKSKSTKTERSTLQSLKSLIGNKMFMAFVIAATFTALSVNVFQFLLVDIFRDKGLNGDHSSLALLLMSLFSILGRFSSGTLTVILQVTVLHISIVGSSVLAISYVSLIFVKSLPLSLFVSCVFGVCMGICRAQFTVTISRLLDGKSLSLGMGLLFTLYGCLNIFMGTICGYARDQLGSYRPIFVGAAAVAGTGSCLFGIAQYFSSRNKRQKVHRNVNIY